MAVSAATERAILRLHRSGCDAVEIACDLLIGWDVVDRVLAEAGDDDELSSPDGCQLGEGDADGRNEYPSEPSDLRAGHRGRTSSPPESGLEASARANEGADPESVTSPGGEQPGTPSSAARSEATGRRPVYPAESRGKSRGRATDDGSAGSGGQDGWMTSSLQDGRKMSTKGSAHWGPEQEIPAKTSSDTDVTAGRDRHPVPSAARPPRDLLSESEAFVRTRPHAAWQPRGVPGRAVLPEDLLSNGQPLRQAATRGRR